MKVTVSTQQFTNNILNPVSKLSENLLLKFERTENKSVAKTFVSSADNSVILLSEVECKVDTEQDCVIPDCKTFLRLFSGIEDNEVTLQVETNVIKYKSSSNFSFKYHLLDESYLINKKSISETKLKALTYDTTFILSKQKLSEIIKFNSIIPDAEKLYFFSQDGCILVKVGDEQKSTTNEIITDVSKSFSGSKMNEGFPLDIKNILLFAFNENEIEVSVNHTLKVFKFQSGLLTYIVSGLVK